MVKEVPQCWMELLVGSHIALFTLAAHDILPTFLTEDSIFFSARGDELVCENGEKAAVLLISAVCRRPDVHGLSVLRGRCVRGTHCTRAFAFQIG